MESEGREGGKNREELYVITLPNEEEKKRTDGHDERKINKDR